MPRTEITGDQVRDETITGDDVQDGSLGRDDLNITSTGKAVVRKVIAGDLISIDSTGVDAGTGDVTVNFISSEHRSLDQLVHGLAESNYYEITRSGNQVSNETWWVDSDKLVKIREIDYTYSGGFVTQIVTKQYDSGGDLIVGETLTETISRTGTVVTDITAVLT